MIALLISLASTTVAVTACDDGNRNAIGTAPPGTSAPAVSVVDAERRLEAVMLTADDLGGAYSKDASRWITNAQAAQARPDTAAAERQYEAWGQVLSYNVQFASDKLRDVVNTPLPARIMHNATIYNDTDGAGTAMVYLRALPLELLENILTNDGAGARIAGAQVQRDIAFPGRGDELYALRTSGKATISDRLTVSFIADTVFVRVGNLNGAITAVALGDAPDRAMLERLVDRFVEKARAA
jgi:hypothetical protein